MFTHIMLYTKIDSASAWHHPVMLRSRLHHLWSEYDIVPRES